MARTRRRQSRGSAKKKRGFSPQDGEDQVLGKLGLGDDNEEEEIALDLDTSDDDAAAGGLGHLADDMEEEKGWGKDKRAFYDGDDYEEDLDDDLGIRAEEEEAITLQHQQAEELDEGDFDKDLGVVQSSKKKTKKKTTTPKKLTEKAGGVDGVEDEPEEDAALMKELLDRLQEVRKNLAPLMENITGPSSTQTLKKLEEMQKESENPGSIDRGVSYLEMKFQLMLVYCMNLAYFLFRRSKGLSAKSHPVVENLLRARTYFERLRPLDKRMRYQIDALLSSLPGKDGKTGSDATSSADRSVELRSFKPHVDDFVSGEDLDGGKKSEEGELVRAEKMRMEAVDLDDPKSRKRREKRVARAQDAVRRSRLIQEMEEEFSEKPIEVESIGAIRLGGGDESEEEQEKFEEEHLTRLRVNRETKKRRAQRERERMKSALDDGLMQDWEDFVDLSKRIDRGVHSLQQGKTTTKVGGDTDVHATEDLLDGDGSGEEMEFGEEDMSEDEMYSAAQKERKVTKKRKLAEDQSSREVRLRSHDGDFATVKGGERRKATKEMIQNRGLVAYRKKDDRNPRVKMRRKYDKGLQRRKGQVAPMRERSTHYAGETTGIKKKVTKSVRFV